MATDKFTGYRLYSAGQIQDLQKILLFRDMDFNVKEIAAGLEKWNEQAVMELLAAKKKEILCGINREQQRIEKIDTAVQDFKNRKIDVHYNVVIKKIPSYNICSLREVIANHFCEGVLWEKIYEFVAAEHIALAEGVNNLAIYHNEDGLQDGVEVETGVIVKKTGANKDGFVYRKTEAVAKMACIMVHGAYENIGPAYHSFAYWLEEHRQYEMAGPIRQICHIGVYDEEDADKFLTEVQTPVKKIKQR